MKMYEPMRGLDGRWYVRQITDGAVFLRTMGGRYATLYEAEAYACEASGFDPEHEMLRYRVARREYKRRIKEGK